MLSSVEIDILYDLFNAAAFIGFTYAVLRHRLVTLQWILNRALVSAIAIAIVLAVFGFLESLIEHEVLGPRASALVALAVPLVLGILFDQLNKRVERWVKYLFFRKQFRAEAALAQFSWECGYITDAGVLVERAVAEVQRDVGAPAAGVYENAGDSYHRLYQRGNRTFPEHLAIDDPACVRLRAKLGEIRLDDVDSSLGADGVAFPVALRGALTGLLVLAPRPGELYTPKERELLQHLIHQVGTSLHAMYVSQTRAFVTDVASGLLPSSEQTRAMARQLTQAPPPA
jgi:K+-sensing histidine kinase KdpD